MGCAEEKWRQLSQEIGAEFSKSRFLNLQKVQAHVGPWTVTLDTFSAGQILHTRMRAPFVSPAGFRFMIYPTVISPKNPLSRLGKLLGMQDIEMGDPVFDEAFVVKGNDESRVRELFADPKIRQMIEPLPAFNLNGSFWSPQVTNIRPSLFRPRAPKDAGQLYFEISDVITDVPRLEALFDLFAAVLDQLCRIGSASRQTPKVQL